MYRRHELYIACSNTSYEHLVKNLAAVLAKPPEEIERGLEMLLRRLFPRLARSREILAALLNARVRAALGAPGRSQRPSKGAGSRRSRRVPRREGSRKRP